MGDAGQSHEHHHHHHGYQSQLLSFGGHQFHQFGAQQPPAPAPAPPARVRGGGGGGEIVAVQGGHIVRSTGRKDRHSKVCTARGPRDRRVRLSAHTAIQFYDVQDRLGYDRPSKAVDWLIKNAKDAIDKLDVLPEWQPSATAANAAAPPSSSHPRESAENSDEQQQAVTVAQPPFDFSGGGGGSGGAAGGGFLPASLDSDAIADTIKSFFPMAAAGGSGASTAATPSSAPAAVGFQSYTPDLLSRTGSQSQELRLSLQSFQDSIFHHHHQQQHAHGSAASEQQPLYPGAAASLAFGSGAIWPDQPQSQRMVPWNLSDPGGGNGGGGGSGSGGGGYLFNVSLPQPQSAAAAAQMHPVLGQGQFFIQRGPLQSSNQPSDRGWPEPMLSHEADHPMHHPGLYPSVSSIGFASGTGFSRFRIPARIQGDEEHNDGGGGNGDQPPSVSSASHH